MAEIDLQPETPSEGGKSFLDSQPDVAEMPEEKKKFPKWIIPVVLLAIVLAGAGYYAYTLSKRPAKPSTSTAEVETKHSFVMIEGDKLVAYNPDSKSTKTLATDLGEHVQLVAWVPSDDGNYKLYFTTRKDVNNKDLYSFWQLSTGSKPKLIKDLGEGPWHPVANQSADLFAFRHEVFEGDQLNASIRTLDLKGNVKTVLTEPSQSGSSKRGPLIPFMWSSDSKTLYVEELTCTQCDGPAKAIIHSLDIETGKVVKTSEPQKAVGSNYSEGIYPLPLSQKFVASSSVNGDGKDNGKEIENIYDSDPPYELMLRNPTDNIRKTVLTDKVDHQYGDYGYVTPSSDESKLLTFQTFEYKTYDGRLLVVDLKTGEYKYYAIGKQLKAGVSGLGFFSDSQIFIETNSADDKGNTTGIVYLFTPADGKLLKVLTATGKDYQAGVSFVGTLTEPK